MISKETRVQTRDICTDCTMGVVPNPAWVEWSKERDIYLAIEHKNPNWSSSKRIYEFDEWEKIHPMPDCGEEDICPECEGTRIILRWITIDEFLTECRLFFDAERNHTHPCCEDN